MNLEARKRRESIRKTGRQEKEFLGLPYPVFLLS
jgi:hypothetical protein